jgi:hypothetical protein
MARPPRHPATLAAVLLLIAARPALAASTLVAHEWGTFTQHLTADGQPVAWRPLQVPSDLPGFVLKASARATRKNSIEGNVRMETPVIYFYADRQETVSVRVGFPAGLISEWYPRAKWRRGGIRWPRVAVLPDSTATLLREPAPSHYYPARETDAALVRCRSGKRAQVEKFLFYRGVGSFDLPVSARLDGDRVVVRNAGPTDIRSVLVIASDGTDVGHASATVGADDVTVDRPVPSPEGLAALEDALRAVLVGEGLFEREAQAMIDTWRTTWSQAGVRVLYVVPRALTDAVLPLAIAPKPAALVRVLIGRAEMELPGVGWPP